MNQSFELNDIHNAVSAGVLTQNDADRLAKYLFEKQSAGTALADEEQFRLISSFNDIFVTIGLALFLGALVWLVPPVLKIPNQRFDTTYDWFGPGLAVATASWGLAEIFTKRRRMALPSIVLMASFVGAVTLASVGLFGYLTWFNLPTWQQTLQAFSFASIAGALAAGLHWWRFKVPVTVAAGAAAFVGLLLAGISIVDDKLLATYPLFTILPAGLAVMALAFWFDASDRLRLTRRADIAFWLHLLAAPLIVHSIVWPMTVGRNLSGVGAGVVIAIFVVMSLVALVIDRRALLVSSLTYFGYAAFTMLGIAGWGASGAALATLTVGATVLLLSVGWQVLRSVVVGSVPQKLRAIVPPLKN